MTRSQHAARLLLDARRPGTALNALPDELIPTNKHEAYSIQATLVDMLSLQSGRPVGYKVGCTNATARQMLALDSPFSGRCFENEITQSPDTIDASDLHMVGIEPEIALRISKDFEPFQDWRAENVIPYIDAVIPAIEVVESRFSTWPLMGFLSAIADNGVHRRLVLGDPITHWTPEQIEGAHVILKSNDQVVRQGYADNVDGGPFGVIAWLANHLNDLGTTLNAGDIVSTGVMTDIYDSAPGETLVAEYDLPAHVHLNIT